MRVALICLVTLAVTPAAAQSRGGPWSVAATATLAAFGAAARDRAEEEEFTIRPSGGVALSLEVARQLGAWRASFGVSHLPTYVEARSSEVAVQERTMSLDRLRLALTLGRRIARIGTGQLEGRGSAMLDNWSVAGEDERTVAGGEAALALQLPLGRFAVENSVGIGWTAGPFRRSELPTGYRRLALRTVTAGVGVRFGF